VLLLSVALTPLLAVPVVADEASTANPRFLTGPNEGDPEDIALDHLRTHDATRDLSAADVAELAVRSSIPSTHTGATHVEVQQQLDGLEVFGASTTVTVAADDSVAHVAGVSVSGLRAADVRATTVDLDATEAVAAAADALELEAPEDLEVLSFSAQSDAQETLLSDGGISDEPIPARLGWHASDDGLRLAWQLVIDDVSDVNLWNATVDATNGRLLELDDWTDQTTPDELASTLQRADGRTSAAVTRLRAASPGPGATVFESSNPVRDGSRYRVFPQEGPDDGPRILSVEPADGTASPFGWHDVSATPEPDHTITRGNDVHAYTDRDATNQPDPGSEPDGGPELDFDLPMDLGEHPQHYAEAALVNLFWWCNISHDLFHLYGFDEPSGNFQVNNYGRGGVGGDDVMCEGMDGSGHNNANFSTPAQDGGRPRMQTYIELGSGLPSAITVDEGPAAGTYLAHYARFTPPATTVGLSGTLVLVDDGSDVPTGGCEPYTLPEGSIAVVDTTGACTNRTQVANAEEAGASAVVVVHTANNPTFMSGSMDPPATIPAVRVGAADGAAIKAAIADEPAAGSVHRNRDRPPLRVGDLDTATIIREYSHGVSNRLTGGPTQNCLGTNANNPHRLGEGWSDYHAIVALLDTDLDHPEMARGIFPYVIYQPPRTWEGLRPRPYSRNMEIQPFTYDSVKTGAWLNGGSLSMPHGIGHGFAAVTWDLTWDLIDKHGYNPNLYDDWSTGGNNLSYQLVMDGLKIQGCLPGFLDARDAILVADELLTGGDNRCTLWATFARRGMGYSADQGVTSVRNDSTEAFDTHPDCERGFRGQTASGDGQLNTARAGSTVAARFELGRGQGSDVLASNSPFSRQVDCDTLEVVSQGQHVTPRAYPVNTQTPGRSGLTHNGFGLYHYPWATDADWSGTCRELVLTRTDGVQHRAFFRFT
jgi:extracellular elastinolytic metalloproteinase